MASWYKLVYLFLLLLIIFIFRKVFDLQKNFKDSTTSYHWSCIQFPLILITYISMVHLSQVMNWYWRVIIKSSPHFIQISFVLTKCPFSVPRLHPDHHFALSHYVSLDCCSCYGRISVFDFDGLGGYWLGMLEDAPLWKCIQCFSDE